MPENRSNADELEFFAKKGFGLKIGFGKRPAFIVIDMTPSFTDYTNPQMLLASNLDQEIVEIKRILEAARSCGVPIIYTNVAYDDGSLKDAGVWAKKMKGAMTLRAGTPEVEIHPAFNRREDEMVITKKYASVFFGTDLASRLISQGIDSIILAGTSTSGCVRATAVDGISYGFRPIVVREAVGDRSQIAHEQSLFDLQAKYADVVSIEEVLNYLKNLE